MDERATNFVSHVLISYSANVLFYVKDYTANNFTVWNKREQRQFEQSKHIHKHMHSEKAEYALVYAMDMPYA